MIPYAIANIIAVGMAILFVYLPSSQNFFMPWFVVTKNIPYVAIAPIPTIGQPARGRERSAHTNAGAERQQLAGRRDKCARRSLSG